MSEKQPIVSENQRLALNIALKTGFGFSLGGISALLLARKAGGRLFITGIATGAGLGYAWCQNDMYLKDPKLCSIPISFQNEFDEYWKRAAAKVPSFAKFK